MKSNLYLSLVFFLCLPLVGFNQSNVPKFALEGEAKSFTSNILDNSFAEYEVFKIDFSDLKARSKEEDLFELKLNLGNHQWNLVLLHNDLRTPGFKETTRKGDQLSATTKRRATTFKGYANNPGSLGEETRFNISDHWISGFVTVHGQELFIEPLRMTDPNADEDHYVIYRPEAVLQNEDHPCTVHMVQQNNPYAHQHQDDQQKESGGTMACVEAELVTACTWDYVDALGSTTLANDRIAAIINLVEGLYSPFSIAYVIVEQFAPATLADDPFTASVDAIALLNSMGSYAQNNMVAHDLGQLWTDRNISGCGSGTGLIGCAWINTVCGNIPYSVCENWSSNDNCLRTLSAHEFGHNWNASHGNSNNSTIMRPSINCNATTFTAANITAVQNKINSTNCLAQIGTTEVYTTDISPRLCILDKFTINGEFTVCVPASPVSIDIQFSQNGVVLLTVLGVVDLNGFWSLGATIQDLIALGLNYGNWYDVVPVLSLADGSTVVGSDYKVGLNNDLYFADQSNPMVEVNNSPVIGAGPMKRLCVGGPIFYHGTDPLSGNHLSSIRRRPIGSPFPFFNFQNFGEVGVSLDGYNGDLNAQYPGYFIAGYEYQLTIQSFDKGDNCIALTPVVVYFEVVDCCLPDFELSGIPDCVEDGVKFTVHVSLEAPLTAADIERIYSYNNDYTYISHTALSTGSSLELDITFVSNSCTCEGNALIFDIVLVGCPDVTWVMTDKIPCCTSPCKDTYVKDWKVDDCIIINGLPARYFCLEVSSGPLLIDVSPGSNNATCQVNLLNLQITQVSFDGVYTICGYMQFTDPNCVGHSLVTIVVETEKGVCCTIEQPFSFPEGCDIADECYGIKPDIQTIYSKDGETNISLNIPLDETVVVIDHVTGITQTVKVGKIKCGPFAIDINGNIFGGTSCAGISIKGPEGIDCRRQDGVRPMIPYFLEIRWGKCVWIISGDYCNELIIYPQSPIDPGKLRSEEMDKMAASGAIKVYPNPVSSSGLLYFDMGSTTSTLKQIQISDLYGKTIESFIPAKDQKVFDHQLPGPLAQGIYFVIFHHQDGSTSSTRLVAVE